MLRHRMRKTLGLSHASAFFTYATACQNASRYKSRMAGKLFFACLLLTLSACNRPMVSNADPTGTERLPLRGEPERIALLERDVRTPEGIISRGTRVWIWETWLLRKDPQTKPPGYRVSGLYDPASQSKGLVLPRGTIHVYFYGPPADDSAPQKPVAIPQEAVRIETENVETESQAPAPPTSQQ